MKNIKPNILIILSIVLFSGKMMAQNTTNKFCRVMVSATRTNTEHISIDYGKNEIFNDVNDTDVIPKLEKVKMFSNVVDALNYLSSLGWDYINTISILKGYTGNYNYGYIFRKTFLIKN